MFGNTKKAASVAVVSVAALGAVVGIMAGSTEIAVALGANERSALAGFIAPLGGCTVAIIIAALGCDAVAWWKGRKA